MLKPVYAKQFNKDIKRSKKRGKDLEKLKDVICLLAEKKKLPVKNKDHKLTGNFHEYRECHIEPNWLLIYKIEGRYIFFVRTGTHSDLFEQNKIDPNLLYSFKKTPFKNPDFKEIEHIRGSGGLNLAG